MNLRKYLKRIIKAVLNRPIEEFTMEKEYVISNEENGRFNEKVAVVTGGTGTIGGCSYENEKSKNRSDAFSFGCWK